MTGTVLEVLTVRRALVRAHISAERHLATAQSRELRKLYEDDCQAIAAALRIVEGTTPELSAEERAAIDQKLEALRQAKPKKTRTAALLQPIAALLAGGKR